MLGFVTAHLALSAGLAAGAWWWLDRERREAAVASAEAVGRVLARGGFSPTPDVLERMRALTGYDFRLVEPDAPVDPGTVRVTAVGTTIAIAYRTPAYLASERTLWWAVLGWATAGTVAFAALARWQAGRLARPVEDLAAEARRLGTGAWDDPVPAVGSGEVRDLAAEVEALRRRLVDLLEASRRADRLTVLGGFAATIAHEVRNPLSAVRLTVRGLARHGVDGATLDLLEGEIERLDLIVDEVLAYGRGLTITPGPTDLAVEAATVVRLLIRQADHLGVELTVAGPATAVVQADARRVRQVAVNLVVNALQAAARGTSADPTVVVRVLPDGLEVEDDGPGIPEDLAPFLFQPFRSGRADGTGLGLHLAHAIATAHGVSLTWRRAANRTCFRFGGLPAV